MTTNDSYSQETLLTPDDTQRLANLCGQFDEHLQQIANSLDVEINNRGASFSVVGVREKVEATITVLEYLYQLTETQQLNAHLIHLNLQESGVDALMEESFTPVTIRTRKGVIKARGKNQADYVNNILTHDLTFGIGPAGTGKTYLAVACAVHAFENDEVRRIILVRPAVEAGERLGFLPGDLSQKVDPYLRPLYDALYEMFGYERVEKLLERNNIEIAPLAYMRGRTLNESFIIMDEAQNTTVEQMKMFLTRIGFGSTAVVTGDVTQIDLPKSQKSGLIDVASVLADIEGIKFTQFAARDVVRHPLVKRIVTAYDRHEKQAEHAK